MPAPGYLSDLFKYHHEKRQARIITPPVPSWKGIADDRDDEDDEAGDEAGAKEQVWRALRESKLELTESGPVLSAAVTNRSSVR